jgi:metallo-beta-lactamase family protein
MDFLVNAATCMRQKCRCIQIDIDMAVRRFGIISYAKGKILVAYPFQDAGDILGSAMAEPSFGDKKLVFSDYLGRLGSPILRHPEKVNGADELVLESTYGHKDYVDIEVRGGKLLEILLETLDLGGKF